MRPAVRSLVSLVVLVVVYYAVPTGVFPSATAAVVSVVGLVVGVGVLAVLIVAQIRRQARAGADSDGVVRLQSLLMLVYLSVVVFAFGYYLLADATDDQFAGLETRTDALYFTVTTLATVGFGDVHPTGQAARALVTGQIVFNLVFLASLVSLLTHQVRRRADASRAARSDGDPAP